MSIVSAELADRISPALKSFAEKLEGSQRTEASTAMGEAVQALVVAHLRELAASRHSTAQRLGASPTNYLTEAVNAASDASVVKADGDGVTLHLRHPVISRAFRDIHIEAKGAGALTIPISAMAYGRRASEFDLYSFRSKTTGNSFLALRQDDRGAKPLLMYLLVRSVTQQQDRSLMPSGDEILDAAASGLSRYVRALIGGLRR